MKKLIFLLSLMVLFANSYSQNYQAGTSIEKSSQMHWNKQNFPVAGDKFLQINIEASDEDIPILTAILYNPDFSIFKTFTHSAPSLFPEVFHGNRAKCFEIANGDQLNYYFVFQAMLEEDDQYLTRCLVLSDAGELLADPESSWMGFDIFENNGAFKIASSVMDYDTIYYNYPDLNSWTTIQIYTSTITDMLTGELEFTFPRGTRFSGVAEIDGAMRIVTQNNNLVLYTEGHHTATLEDGFINLIYNMDYSVHKTMERTFDIEEDQLYHGSVYDLITGGENTYFYHSLTYQDNDDYSITHYLMDEDGELLNTTELELSVIRAIYLSATDKDYIWSSGALYIVPELNMATPCHFIAEKSTGEIKIIYTQGNQIKILNDDFSAYKTVDYDAEWSLVEAGYDVAVKSDQIILVFTKADFSDGILVLNEEGETVINIPDFKLITEWPNSLIPMMLFSGNEKYARIISNTTSDNPDDITYNITHYRTGDLSVSTKIAGVAANIPVELYKMQSEEMLLEETQNTVGGNTVFTIGEGEYYLKAIGEEQNALNGYYTDALIWEDATHILFTTDNSNVHEIDLETLPAPLDGEGAISGTVIDNRNKNTSEIEQEKNVSIYDLFLINRNTQQPVSATKNAADGKYIFENVNVGNYIILIDVPGMAIMLVNEVSLINETDEIENVNYTITDEGVYGNSPSSVTNIVPEKLNVYPNPATDYIYVSGLTGKSEVRIYDVNGRMILQTTDSEVAINISQLKSGTYLIQIIKEGKSQFGKIVKM